MDWETILPPLIGFLGVCITLWWTGKASLLEARRNRESERDALIESLLGELTANAKILEPYVVAFDYWEDQQPPSSKVKSVKLDAWIITSTFDDSTSRLGLLDKEAIRKITFCYSNLKMLLFYIENHRTYVSADTRNSHGAAIELKADNMKSLGAQLRNCLGSVNTAVSALENL